MTGQIDLASAISSDGGKDDALKGCKSVGTIDAGVKQEIPMVKPHLAAGTSIPKWEIRHAK